MYVTVTIYLTFVQCMITEFRCNNVQHMDVTYAHRTQCEPSLTMH